MPVLFFCALKIQLINIYYDIGLFFEQWKVNLDVLLFYDRLKIIKMTCI